MGDYTAAINLDVEFLVVTCGECGGTYGIASRYAQQKKDEGGSWHCPYCQVGWGYGETTLDRLMKEKRELKLKLEREETRRRWEQRQKEQARAEATHEAARANGFKGAMVKAKKRVGRGVCPCCNRSFEDLRRHMASKHPEYADEDPMPEDLRFHCGATTATGDPCSREVNAPDATCWQHS